MAQNQNECDSHGNKTFLIYLYLCIIYPTGAAKPFLNLVSRQNHNNSGIMPPSHNHRIRIYHNCPKVQNVSKDLTTFL